MRDADFEAMNATANSKDTSFEPKLFCSKSYATDDSCTSNSWSSWNSRPSLSWPKRKGRIPGTQWQTTWKRCGPLLGLGCIMLSIASVFANLTILLVSDNKEATWRYQPSTYLAISTAVANQSMRFAAFQGVVIAWWCRAMRLEGLSLSSLHDNWDLGTNIWSALTAGRRTSLLAIACLVSTFVAVDGPLLQQSSKVVSVEIPSNDLTAVSLTFNVAPELPAGYTGTFDATALPDPMSRRQAGESSRYQLGPLRDHVMNTTIKTQVRGCSKSCKTTLQAPAFSIKKCEYVSKELDYYNDKDTVWPFHGIEPYYADQNIFVDGSYKLSYYTGVNWTVSEREYLNVTSTSVDLHTDEQCAGIANYTSCILESARAEYEVVINNMTEDAHDDEFRDVTITLPTSVAYPTILGLAENTLSLHSINRSDPEVPATLVGFASGSFDSACRRGVVEAGYATDLCYTTRQDFVFAHQKDRRKDDPECKGFRNAFDDLLDSLNRLMFRVAISSVEAYREEDASISDAMDPGLIATQVVHGHLTGDWNAYQTDFSWYLGATAAELLCILLILPTYWGWWRIGRPVSFSPLEIAKAFDAPLLADSNSNMEASEIAKLTDERIVRYGAFGRGGEDSAQYVKAEKLTFADKEDVYRPLDTFNFQH